MTPMKTLFSVGLAASALCPIDLAAAKTDGGTPTATIDSGRLTGVRAGGVDAYLGIPYAAPPVGENRWRSPQPVTPWKTVRAADAFGPSCPQNMLSNLGPYTQEYFPSGATSEDCLTVSVWKPADASKKKLPVFVWIHGGGFTSGSASVPIYDGTALARDGVVVVSINYRVGFLGSFGAAELRDTGGGNFGLQDQIAALEWVKRNAGSFGGDAGRVTIAGQSAGAFAVHQLILAPKAKGLFHQAIPMSGVSMGTGFDGWLDTRENAEKNAATLLQAAGVSTLEEARKLPIETLRAANTKAGAIAGSAAGFRNKPYADGALLPLDPAKAFMAGEFNDTPVMIGLARDEGAGPNAKTAGDAAKYEADLTAQYGAIGPALAKAYPYENGAPLMSRVNLDARVGATIAWSAEHARASRYPVFAYVWTHVRPTPDAARFGAFHTSEVPYIFGTLAKSPASTFTPADERIAEQMRGYWVNFIKSGNPNGSSLAVWPVFGERHTLFELGEKFAPRPALAPATEALFVNHVRSGHSMFGM